MSQYLKLLSHCRIPGKETDSVQSTSIENSHHIIVIHNDHVSNHVLFHNYMITTTEPCVHSLFNNNYVLTNFPFMRTSYIFRLIQ